MSGRKAPEIHYVRAADIDLAHYVSLHRDIKLSNLVFIDHGGREFLVEGYLEQEVLLRPHQEQSQRQGQVLVKKDPDSRRSLMLDLLMPMRAAQDVQANLEELMPIWIKAHGQRRANSVRFAQLVRIIIGHHCAPLLAFAERLLKIVYRTPSD